MEIDLRKQLTRNDVYLHEALGVSKLELFEAIQRGLRQYPTPDDLLNSLDLEPEKVDTVIREEVERKNEVVSQIVAKVLLTRYEKISIEQFVLLWGLIRDYLRRFEPREERCANCPGKAICVIHRPPEENLKEEETQYIY